MPNLIRNKIEPRIEKIKICVERDIDPNIINMKRIKPDKNIYKQSKTFYMPIPHSENVNIFREYASSGYYNLKNSKLLQGCYIVHRENRNKTSQSNFLSKRIRQDAGIHNKATSQIYKEFKVDCKVLLCTTSIYGN